LIIADAFAFAIVVVVEAASIASEARRACQFAACGSNAIIDCTIPNVASASVTSNAESFPHPILTATCSELAVVVVCRALLSFRELAIVAICA